MSGRNTAIRSGKKVAVTRREFLTGVAAGGIGLAAAGIGINKLVGQSTEKLFLEKAVPGTLTGAASHVGHLLRSGSLPPPSRELSTRIAIVGGGISGLSAAWALSKRRFNDYMLLELEAETGGNSRGGINAVSAYPWGAHYVPIPNLESRQIIELFEDLGIIEGYDSRGLPIYHEYFLCADPHERLNIHGVWQEGLIPNVGLSDKDQREFHQFFTHVEYLKTARGGDGRRAFSIPLEESSRDPKFIALDRISMSQFLKQKGWDSVYLRWYVNYCCRDDYGCQIEDVSAWAGLHYFAARMGLASNADPGTVLTWPEGNAWIAHQLRNKISIQSTAQDRIQCHALVTNIQRNGTSILLDYYDTIDKRTTRVTCDSVIFAAPRFVASKVIQEYRQNPPPFLKSFSYTPWMVANITLNALPQGSGAPLAWDNVSFQSPSLGYIVATHQSLNSHPKNTVITYYLPLNQGDPSAARKEAAARSHRQWVDLVIADLQFMHPTIKKSILRVDVWLWGHAMAKPTPGFIWGASRAEALKPMKGIFFAHSDMSGISIFEEAHYRGVQAAKEALKWVS